MFHTRQQHTIKVAQVGRRLAEICLAEQADESAYIGLNVEVVEAACLAHDLGHPPFGHVGEDILHQLVLASGDKDGFEGNAQTFRVITKLAVRFPECAGLDLTRATLAACIKYPWFRDENNIDRQKKWGAYKNDEEDFQFAREFFQDVRKTAEAELMDWADDIAYSVHDLEDFHRCGILPWHNILTNAASEKIIERAIEAWHGHTSSDAGRLREALRNLRGFLQAFRTLLTEPYQGTRKQREQLRTMTSQLIGRYIRAARINSPSAIDQGAPFVLIDEDEADEVRVLKQITRDYIIQNPSLIAQQKGQKRLIEDLFNLIMEDTKSAPPNYLPVRLSDQWSPELSKARFVADCISSLTEAEVVGLYKRLTGTSSGSVLDPIVR